MSRWWRAQDSAVDNPKLILLSDKQHRAWFNLCCVCSQNGGTLPAANVIAVKLRVTAAKAKAIVAELAALRLVDIADDGTAVMHDWSSWQYKTDNTDPTTAKRSKKYRDRRRDATVPPTVTVTVTPPCQSRLPDTESEADTEPEKKISEAVASDAGASPDGDIPSFLDRTKPRDIRGDLFGRGLKTLAAITGKTPDSCRALVGKWLKSVNDEAIHILGAIDDAERNRVADPVAWINRALQPHTGDRNGKRTVHDAAANLTQRLRSLDEPAPDLREREGGSAVRQLPAR